VLSFKKGPTLTRKEYGDLKILINQECQKKLDALDIVWEMIGDKTTGLEKRTYNTKRTKATDALETVALDFDEPFGVKQLVKKTNEAFPDVNATPREASNILFRLANRQLLKLVSKSPARSGGNKYVVIKDKSDDVGNLDLSGNIVAGQVGIEKVSG
jgi:hypothetical protein